jgi:hypothetical protein
VTQAESLDDFLGPEEVCATFHDASLVSLVVDFERKELRERRRRGRLRFTGLRFWVVDPPDQPLHGSSLPWLTSDGPLLDARTEAATRLAKLLSPGVSGWYLFFSDWNAFAYLGAECGSFEWV